MIDASAISSLLYAEWNISNPAKASVKFSIDEYTPNDPSFQILCENLGSKSEFLTGIIDKVTQTIKVTVFLKPSHYAPTLMTTAKVTFYNAIAEIDRIIREGRNETPGRQYNLTGWFEVKIPKGAGAEPEPLILSLSQNVEVRYYR